MKESKGRNQAEMIHAYKAEVMKAEEPRRPFVNAGAPSHGVLGGDDTKNATDEHVEHVDVCGYAYKGYAPEAWKY